MADVQPTGGGPALAGSSGPTLSPRAWLRESSLCVVLLVVTAGALALRLALPGPLSTPAGQWALYVVSLQAGFAALWEVLEGFVWARQRNYVRGAALLAAASTLYVVAGP